ncbi:MAG TPA: hypothetical protein VF666_19780 [Pyrinomonadaceae bacterium]
MINLDLEFNQPAFKAQRTTRPANLRRRAPTEFHARLGSSKTAALR